MRMPFGRYFGVTIEDLPDGYLRWLHTGASLYGDLRAAVDAELRGAR